MTAPHKALEPLSWSWQLDRQSGFKTIIQLQFLALMALGIAPGSLASCFTKYPDFCTAIDMSWKDINQSDENKLITIRLSSFFFVSVERPSAASKRKGWNPFKSILMAVDRKHHSGPCSILCFPTFEIPGCSPCADFLHCGKGKKLWRFG